MSHFRFWQIGLFDFIDRNALQMVWKQFLGKGREWESPLWLLSNLVFFGKQLTSFREISSLKWFLEKGFSTKRVRKKFSLRHEQHVWKWKFLRHLTLHPWLIQALHHQFLQQIPFFYQWYARSIQLKLHKNANQMFHSSWMATSAEISHKNQRGKAAKRRKKKCRVVQCYGSN